MLLQLILLFKWIYIKASRCFYLSLPVHPPRLLYSFRLIKTSSLQFLGLGFTVRVSRVNRVWFRIRVSVSVTVIML